MAPSAVLTKLRGNGARSYSTSTHLDDHNPLPHLQTSGQGPKLNEFSSSPANTNPMPGFGIPNLPETPTDDLPASRMTASSKRSNEPHRHRPYSATAGLERPALSAAETVSAVPSRAHNFVFSLQPPKNFTASLTATHAPIPSPNPASGPVSGYRPNLKNISTTSLSVAEDITPSKSATSRLGKAKFNLLNPLNLLARRRLSHNQLTKAEDGSLAVNSGADPSFFKNYDPRIRGNIVHDFSVPKARRVSSYNGVSSAESSPSVESRPSTQSNSRATDQWPPFGSLGGRTSQSPAHSPLFKEHFTDDRNCLQPENTGYLHAFASSPVRETTNDPPILPAFAKSLPLDIFGDEDCHEKGAVSATANLSPSSDEVHVSPPRSPTELPSPECSQPPVCSSVVDRTTGRRSPPVQEFPVAIENLPKHMTSISSKFSFQLSGIDSEAQERLLEEKHRQQAASKLLVPDDDRDDLDFGEDRYADAEPDDDDMLEERIPGVNADMDEELEEHCQHLPLVSSHPTSPPGRLSSNTLLTASQSTSRDSAGQVIGLANSKTFPDTSLVSSTGELQSKALEQLPWFGDPGVTSLQNPSSQWTGIVRQLSPLPEPPREECDDMYFDDGNIDCVDDLSNGESFDEAIFDDESGAIRDIPAQITRNREVSQQHHLIQLGGPGSFPGWSDGVSIDQAAQLRTFPILAQPGGPKVATGVAEQQQDLGIAARTQRSGLTEDNLAYQDALALAANEAVAQGRFSRDLSMSQDSGELESRSQVTESHPGLTSDHSRISHFLENAGAGEEPDDFPFSDSLADDPMIAEANAEVLENDDEGFYGHEFGFYARAHGKGVSEKINGGYFGPRGVEGVHRSHSAKANFQEPSLTPITERSEWSHRNSIGSMHTLGLPPPAQAIASPGIAELLDLDPLSIENEMSLGVLMKLRRDAWGGSQTSLNSTGGSQAGSSPIAQLPLRDGLEPQSASPETGPFSGHDFSRHSHDPAARSGEGSDGDYNRHTRNATGTQSTRPKYANAGPYTRAADTPEYYPQHPHQHTQGGDKAAKSHSRASSGAESVSYIKDPQGSGRWLLERRRTGEDGEVELVGREYVAGARI